MTKESKEYATGPRAVFSSALGEVFRAEVQGADEAGGFWIVWDPEGRQLGSIEDHGTKGWKHSSLPVGIPRGSFPSFKEALDARLGEIQSSGGVQSDDLYWEGEGLPRLPQDAREKTEELGYSSAPAVVNNADDQDHWAGRFTP